MKSPPAGVSLSEMKKQNKHVETWVSILSIYGDHPWVKLFDDMLNPEKNRISLERDVEKVRIDVLNGFVSVESAKDDYGVIVDPVTFEITKVIRPKQ